MGSHAMNRMLGLKHTWIEELDCVGLIAESPVADGIDPTQCGRSTKRVPRRRHRPHAVCGRRMGREVACGDLSVATY